jgi:hypothetical protein
MAATTKTAGVVQVHAEWRANFLHCFPEDTRSSEVARRRVRHTSKVIVSIQEKEARKK